MKTKGVSKTFLTLLTIFVFMIVLYMVFPTEIKCLYISSAVKCKNEKVKDVLLIPIEKYPLIFFFKPLVILTADRDSEIKNYAESTLSSNKRTIVFDQHHEHFLIKSLSHKKSGIRRTAASLLGEIKNSNTAFHLRKALKDPDEKVRINALCSLESIKGQVCI